MSEIENEKIVDYLVVINKLGRRFTAENDTRWGGLIEPNPSENTWKNSTGLKVALFASWDYGYLMLETLKEFENKYPNQLNLVGLVTDNSLNPNAKISLKKRVWSLLDKPSRVIDETIIIESGLSHGISVYIGDVKTNSFHDILKKWNPDAILVCVFGQVIDSFTINFPRYGIYNFHPSDLSNQQGAGPAPYEDLVQRNAQTGIWSVHHVTESIDKGIVVGKSPPVYVRDDNRELPVDPIVVYHKLAEVLSPLAFFFVKELVRNFELNKPGRVNTIDFNSLIPDKIKNKIMQPLTQDLWTDIQSVPKDFLYKSG